MRFGTGKILGALAPAFVVLATTAPACAAGAVHTSIHTLHGHGAVTAAPVTLLTISDSRGIDNRISVFNGTGGRLTLIAPEGLLDPDGPMADNCSLDNPVSGQSTATQASCAPGYVQVIVGDLAGGDDSFTAAPDLPVTLGSVVSGQRRPLTGGDGEDRLTGGGMPDFLEGAGDPDTLLGSAGEDLLSGGHGRDALGGGTGRDLLSGGPQGDLLNGGPSQDVCSGAGGRDIGRSCETAKSIP